MKRKYLVRSAGSVAVAAALVACGGGSGGGNVGDSSSGTNGDNPLPDTAPQPAESTVIVGTVTGFGSIYVNGVKFETDDASYRIDDEDRFDDSALGLGMKVRIEGTVNEDGRSGRAESIYYDDDVEGPIDTGSLVDVDETSKTFTIFGLQVLASESDTVYDDGASFAGLAEGQKLEISGYFDGVQVLATRIELQDDLDDEFELKGHVASYDGEMVSLTLLNGESAGPFPISESAEQDIPGDPVGTFVEVKLVDSEGELVVVKIESEDDDVLDDDAGEVSLRGILEDDGAGGLSIDGTALEINDTTEFKPENLRNDLVAGLEVKVEGRMSNGVLVAEEIEGEQGEVEIEARLVDVSSSDPKTGTVTLDVGGGQTLEVQVNGSALFEDDSDLDLNDDDSFDLGELNTDSDFLEIEAFPDSMGQLVATMIEREDELDDTRLEAPVDSFEANVSVTLLGITYTVDGQTEYEVEDTRIDAAAFFERLEAGDMVKVKDVQPDGVADEIDLDLED